MGNCNCFERERVRVTAWGGEDGQDDEKNDGEGGINGSAPATTTTRLKIRMTKGQLRRLLDGAGRGSAVEDVVAEIMSMGDVHVEPVEAEIHRPPPCKLGTIQEDDLDEYYQ
ncbi:hypothetical protein GUJ93_ZPchr0007g4675 [Zizania palustris]|uniref:Uncharacterized protein n=1 Tax=Zizania palustris TaxID=103762 RepID=A0A8J5R689_ZIZPA|nr:hypothetical protein GUJ93_ZPchr2171g28989 [Zizania palustris]KAG8080270.1 hypothetical protein GUJ93_ZPchr0007g4675 [Zizania palustris]